MKERQRWDRAAERLYKRIKIAEEALEEAEEMLEKPEEDESMSCGKRKCEKGKRKPCK